MNQHSLLNEIHAKFVAADRPPNETVIANWLNLNGYPVHAGADKIYRKIDAYSNSRLSEIKSQLIARPDDSVGRGIRKPKPLRAFSIGSILHQLILEPELAAAEDYVFLTPAPRRHLEAARKSAFRNRLLKRVLNDSETGIEKVFTWFDEFYQLPCKAKVDMAYETPNGLHVIDLKSTGARDKKAFLADCRKYEYERQAAFYLDGTGAKTMTIYGIQKRAPYRVFRKRYTKAELAEGRRKYRFILGKVWEMESVELLPGLRAA